MWPLLYGSPESIHASGPVCHALFPFSPTSRIVGLNHKGNSRRATALRLSLLPLVLRFPMSRFGRFVGAFGLLLRLLRMPPGRLLIAPSMMFCRGAMRFRRLIMLHGGFLMSLF